MKRPCKTKDNYIIEFWYVEGKRYQQMQHRRIMEEHLSRKLVKGEIVHHVNGIRNDNRIENLRVMTPPEHTSFHFKGKRHSEERQLKYRIKALDRLDRAIRIHNDAVTK